MKSYIFILIFLLLILGGFFGFTSFTDAVSVNLEVSSPGGGGPIPPPPPPPPSPPPSTCLTSCSEGYTQNSYPDCSCVLIPPPSPPPSTCPTSCSEGYIQNSYPDCSCVLISVPPLPPPPLTCSTSCSEGYTQNSYPDCSCVPSVSPPPPPPPPPGGGGGTGGFLSSVVQEIVKLMLSIIQEIVKSMSSAIREFVKNTEQVVAQTIIQTQKIVEQLRTNPEIQKVVNQPVVDISTKTLSIVAVGTAVATGFMGFIPLATSVADFIFLPLRFISLMSGFFFQRRRRNWGVVYDSVTKQPLDPAYVVLKDQEGKEIDTKITDMNGRFGFLVRPGEYCIEANKTHYQFPSKRVIGSYDELYNNLYHGEVLKIADPAALILNIPMDPLDLDWNEVAKKKYVKFNYKWEVFKRWFPDFLFFLGFLLTVLLWILKPTFFNQIMFWCFLGLWILRRFGFHRKIWGLILDKKNKKPLSFSALRVFYEKLAQQIHFTIADAGGRYYALVEKGKYDASVEKKTESGYQPIKKYEGLEVKKGVLNKDLFVDVDNL